MDNIMNKITAIIVTFNPDLTIFGEILERMPLK